MKQGFTLMELLITVVIISIIASIALPTTNFIVTRTKEMLLQRDLLMIRTALDTYQAKGYAAKNQDNTPSGYPLHLQELVTMRLLRSVPQDPMHPSNSQDSDTYWSKVPYSTTDVGWYDIHSKSVRTALDGTEYATW